MGSIHSRNVAKNTCQDFMRMREEGMTNIQIAQVLGLSRRYVSHVICSAQPRRKIITAGILQSFPSRQGQVVVTKPLKFDS